MPTQEMPIPGNRLSAIGHGLKPDSGMGCAFKWAGLNTLGMRLLLRVESSQRFWSDARGKHTE